MNKVADLHIHSVYSDGELTPEEIFAKAKEAGISAISVTDHDTLGACKECLELSKKYDIEYVPGIEISSFDNKTEYHILGYGVDIENKKLLEQTEQMKDSRFRRAKRILLKLDDLGKHVEYESVEHIANGAPIIRPHIAEAMVEREYVKTKKEAFDKYLGDSKEAHVTKEYFSIDNAIALINDAGGIAALAHPYRILKHNFLYGLVKKGLGGIETTHPMLFEKVVKYYKRFAKQYQLLQTGGSDYHGYKVFDEENFGKFVVPYEKFQKLEARLNVLKL